MNTVLILYPSLFRCKSKFRRKVVNITAKMGVFDVVSPSDPNGLVAEFVEINPQAKNCTIEVYWKEKRALTHAIVFDDGEEFPRELEWLQLNNVPTRSIRTPLTRVVNIKDDPEYSKKGNTASYEYIGRGSYWGNPYSMYDSGESREQVIAKYKYDFERDLFPNKEKSKALGLIGKRLGCFCKPAPCHGDVLADYLNSYDDGQ